MLRGRCLVSKNKCQLFHDCTKYKNRQTDKDAMILDADSSNSVVVVTVKQSATSSAIPNIVRQTEVR